MRIAAISNKAHSARKMQGQRLDYVFLRFS